MEKYLHINCGGKSHYQISSTSYRRCSIIAGLHSPEGKLLCFRQRCCTKNSHIIIGQFRDTNVNATLKDEAQMILK